MVDHSARLNVIGMLKELEIEIDPEDPKHIEAVQKIMDGIGHNVTVDKNYMIILASTEEGFELIE